MNHYIDIKVLPDPEFTTTILINAVYAKCHRVLGQLAQGEGGVSFPHHKKTLGDTLRLHGSQERLKKIMADNWLKALADYTQESDVLSVPESVQYRTVQRIQKKSPHNKRKRAIAKGWRTEVEAEKIFKDDDQEVLTHPYAQLKSLSTGSSMRIFIKHGDILDKSVSGGFSTYGLSKIATIPWF